MDEQTICRAADRDTLRARLSLALRKRRNAIIGNASFRSLAMRTPLVRRVSRRRAKQLFDLTAGFAYTQALLTFVQSGIGAALNDGPRTVEAVAEAIELPVETTERIVASALGIELVVRHGARYALGDLGVALMNEPGIRAMIDHHATVYRDLAQPMTLLSGANATATSSFWQYAGGRGASGTDADGAARYSELMAVTQGFVIDELVASYDFSKHGHLVDIGGGSGTFATRVAQSNPAVAVTVFDLPDVVPLAAKRFKVEGLARARAVGGSFHDGELPGDGDVYTLVRVLYDHDDEPAMELLRALRRSMPPGATLLIAEPMAELPGAASVGTYFELYLAAMRSGRCRSPERIGRMLAQAGFAGPRGVRVRNPVFTGIVRAVRSS